MLDKQKLMALVVFSILMENGQGIVSKAPDYIEEKYRTATSLDIEFLPNMLDTANQARLERWTEIWGKVV